MAVAYVTLTKRQHRSLADLCVGDALRQAAKEFKRAADRPGLKASLRMDEMRNLMELELPAVVQPVFAAAFEQGKAAEEYEREATRRLRADMDLTRR